MADCRFILSAPAGAGQIGELSSATARKVDYVLDGPATATFTLPGDHPDAKLVSELACDLVVLRDNVPIFRGRVGSSGDTLTADVHTATFSAVDYRGMLDRRILWAESTLSFRQVDQGLIAWQMIADSQAQPGGNLGITGGSGLSTGVPRDRDYAAGQKVGEAVTQLGEVINGFDWEIDANLAFNVYYPARGRQTGIDLVFGSQISGATRTVVSSGYANAIRYSGSAQTTAVEVADSSFGPIGRLEAQVADTNLLLQQSVADAAAAELDNSDQLTAGYHLDLFDGWWTPAQLWIGDSAALHIKTGRLDVEGDVMRVVGLSVAYDDAGGEAVSVDLGANPPSMTSRLGDYQSRIENIERSQSAGYLPDAPVGAMYTWPGNVPPQTWGWADGTAYAAAAYPELFAVIGYTYGGAGGTFNVPDCRSRVLVGAGAGAGAGLTPRAQGAAGGAETVSLSTAQTGNHQHGGTSLGGNVDHTHGGTSLGGNVGHTHTGNTGNDTPTHLHQNPSGAGTGGNVGTGVFSGYSGTSGPNTGNHAHPFTTGDQSAGHTHAFSTGGQSAGHTHVFSTDNGSTAGAAHENMPPFIALGQIIRILPPWRPGP